MTKKIAVFYRPEMSVATNNSYSPSAGKPKAVMDDWRMNDNIEPHISVEPFPSATRDMMATAHNSDYLDEVMGGYIDNGFGNRNQAVNTSLLCTSGSMLAATLHALEHGIAVSPTSGFHHAGYGFGGGYCTFNGLIVAARAAKRAGARRILILDMDAHFGDGTEDIIEMLKLEYITHITRGKYNTPMEAMEAAAMVGNLPRQTFDLVIYQAGADLHKADPLGAGILTTAGMITRDRMVFLGCHDKGVPLVWNLAGGYARDTAGTIEPVLALHRNTMLQCIKVYS
jgi:acetoin utilization deacetylase AcuC-like enzyme